MNLRFRIVTIGGPGAAMIAATVAVAALAAVAADRQQSAPAVDWKALGAARGTPSTAEGPAADMLRPARPVGGAAPAAAPAKLPAVEPTVQARPVMTQTFRAVTVSMVKLPAPKVEPGNQAQVDLRPKVKSLQIAVRNQGARGTCSVHAMTFLLEYMYSTRRKLALHDLSEEYLNWAANVVTKKNVDGDFFSNLDLGYQKLGIYLEQLVPYRATFDPNFKVPDAYVAIAKTWERLQPEFIKHWNAEVGASRAQLDRVMALLAADTPVAVGMWWPAPGSFAWRSVRGVPLIVTPTARRVDAVDGHSVALVGFRKDRAFPGGGYFIFRNSFGPGWGDGGYGYVSFEYLLKFANDLVAHGA